MHEQLNHPAAATGILVLFALVASGYTLVATEGPGLTDILLVAAPLLAVYVVAREAGDDVAVGWMVFGAAFIITMPMVMFALLLSFASRGGVDPDLGIRFGPLMTIGPIVQLVAIGLLYLFARMIRRPPS